MDRRVRRTRQRLQQAMVTLIEQKGYDSITVQDILDEADVGRATFYDHFRNKAELLLSGFEDLRVRLEHRRRARSSERADPLAELWDMGAVLFEHAGGHVQTYRALLGRLGGQLATRHLQTQIAEMFRNCLERGRSRSPERALLQNMGAHHAANSLLSLTAWWLEHDTPYPAARMSGYYRRLVGPGLDAIFEGDKERSLSSTGCRAHVAGRQPSGIKNLAPRPDP